MHVTKESLQLLECSFFYLSVTLSVVSRSFKCLDRVGNEDRSIVCPFDRFHWHSLNQCKHQAGHVYPFRWSILKSVTNLQGKRSSQLLGPLRARSRGLLHHSQMLHRRGPPA